MRAVVAGSRYAATVFAIGFVLGAIRIFVTAPWLGELPATALELPFMLAASWRVCGWVIRRHAVPAAWRARAIMAVAAFAVLMLAEVALGVIGFGQRLGEMLGAYAAPAARLGLAGQIGFALIPLLRRKPVPR